MKRLYRSRKEKVFSGVCGGLGKFLGVDPTIIRIIWAVLIFAFGTGILAYIIAMIIIPAEPESEISAGEGRADIFQPNPQSQATSKNLMLIVGIVILAIGVVSLVGVFFGSIGWIFTVGAKVFWPLVIMGVGVLLLFSYIKK